MDAKTFTLKNQNRTNNILFRLAAISLLCTSFLFSIQQVNAQIVVAIEDFSGFAPTNNDGNQNSYLKNLTRAKDIQHVDNTDSDKYDAAYDPISIQKKVTSTIPQSYRNNEVDISLSPNPVDNYLRISKDSDVQLKKLEIIDTQGNTRFVESFQNGSIYVPYLEAGIYNFRIHTNQGPVNKMLVINP